MSADIVFLLFEVLKDLPTFCFLLSAFYFHLFLYISS